MKPQFIAIAAVLVLLPVAQSAYAESVPQWIKSNAGWWADGTISENEFVSGIQYLISENILAVPLTAVSSEKTEGIPDWIKNTATWWSTDAITDREFVSSMQHLIKIGIVSIDDTSVQETISVSDNSELGKLQAQLDSCIDIKKAYDRLNCERTAKAAITAYNYKQNGEVYQVGPISFYYIENEFEITSTGQAILSLSLLAENTGSNDNVTMMCTGPSICNYDVWNGDKAYKYSGMDFTNGQIVLKSGESREFTMLFGPNIGYGGTTFEYDPSKDYYFRISEPWGSFNIPMTLG